MIQSILIANRGEIAIRIARTATRLGIKTYGIRTVKEPLAKYLSVTDTIIDFPETNGEMSEFLDIENIIHIAKENHIESIHPGYGYLSENARLAQRCSEEGILFIGPTAAVMHAMSDKIIAKEIAKKSKVPLLEGSSGCVKTKEEAITIAAQIGYPVIIKAVSGGGGRGMRIVQNKEELPQLYKTASSEALLDFNDSSVFVEKYIENPRHIEVQIAADNYGNVIHLGERECSIQRKHQKLLEETPSPALNNELRNKITSAAVRIAKTANYRNIGTVEFLLDKKNQFYFMEMNTRIQVEHPITEMVTGLDLVELQIRTSSGEKLPITQKEVQTNGWAIECRINAEDAQTEFSPCIGIIQQIQLPTNNFTRIDTGIEAGTEITPWFDSLIAKLIVHGKDRKDTILKALKALDNFHIKGVKTTIPFCKAVLHNQAFQSGHFDTSFINTQLKSPVYQEEDEEFLAALFAVYQYSHLTAPTPVEDTAIDPWVLNRRIRHL